jgi:hypothetical protein
LALIVVTTTAPLVGELDAMPMGGWVPVRVSSPTGIESTPDRIGCSYFGTFLRHLKLLRMTIQQDSYEPDRWWFAPLLYVGVAVAIAAFLLA